MASPALAIDRGVYVGHTSSLQRCIAHAALAISHPYVRSGEIANNNKIKTKEHNNMHQNNETKRTN